MEKTIVYAYKKSTAGTYVFENTEEKVTIYLPKSFFSKQPDNVTITIKA